MKVGDIGVLQNLTRRDKCWNGAIATIVKIGGSYVGSIADYSVNVHGFIIPAKYKDRKTVGIKHFQIRPISDPDQTIEQEQEATV